MFKMGWDENEIVCDRCHSSFGKFMCVVTEYAMERFEQSEWTTTEKEYKDKDLHFCPKCSEKTKDRDYLFNI